MSVCDGKLEYSLGNGIPAVAQLLLVSMGAGLPS